jgi:hypothetical protein
MHNLGKPRNTPLAGFVPVAGKLVDFAGKGNVTLVFAHGEGVSAVAITPESDG